MKVVLASKNKHKLREIKAITDRFDMELVLQSELGLDLEVEENGASFEENSLIKARAVMEATGLPALADDSGICVYALGGRRAPIPPGTALIPPWTTGAGWSCFSRIRKRYPTDSGRRSSCASSL